MDVAQPTVVEMAKVGLTGMITSCSGVLIGLFAYASQAKVINESDQKHIAVAAGMAGTALWLSLASAFLGYLSEGSLVAGGRIPGLWWAAAALYFVCWLLLGGALVTAGLMLL